MSGRRTPGVQHPTGIAGMHALRHSIGTDPHGITRNVRTSTPFGWPVARPAQETH